MQSAKASPCGEAAERSEADEVGGEMLRFAGTSGEFAALFHLIRHGEAVTPFP